MSYITGTVAKWVLGILKLEIKLYIPCKNLISMPLLVRIRDNWWTALTCWSPVIFINKYNRDQKIATKYVFL